MDSTGLQGTEFFHITLIVLYRIKLKVKGMNKMYSEPELCFLAMNNIFFPSKI